MKIHILMGQRKEGYPGEYAPEALACLDENGHSDNPEYLAAEKAKADASGDFENTVIVTLKTNGAAIMELLRPAEKVLAAAVVSE